MSDFASPAGHDAGASLDHERARERLWRVTANAFNWLDWLGHLGAVVVLAYLLLRVAPGLTVVNATGALMLLITLRTAVMRAILQRTLPLTLATRTLAMTLIVAVGAGYGGLVGYWLPADNPVIQFLLTGVIVMVGAGSVTALGARPLAVLLFPIALIVPVAVSTSMVNISLEVPTLLVNAGFTIALCLSGWRMHTLLLRQMNLHQRNEDLVKQLSAEKAEVQQEHQRTVSLADELRFAAHHDVLTGLPNRAMFDELLQSAVSRWQRLDGKFAVLFLDLDRFKAINDEYGHERGDILLKQFASRLRAAIRTADTVARLAGDEFVVTLEGVGSEADVAVAAENILRRCEVAYELNGVRLVCKPSIGGALFPLHGETAADLLDHADQAMYQAKQAGRGTYRLYSDSAAGGSKQQIKIASDLKAAVEHDNFELDWQPQIDLHTQSFSGVEALVRWRQSGDNASNDPSLAGGQFLGAASRAGLIVPIGAWVIRSALQQLAVWRQQAPTLQLTVNLSAAELRAPSLLQRIEDSLRSTGVPGNALLLDINENVILQNMQRVHELSEQLQRLGVGLTIDDYGTAGLAPRLLQQLAIQRVKIDTTVVQQLSSQPDSANLVRSLTAMAQQLGVEVGAEGVETLVQAAALQDAGVQYLQGFLFAEPQSPAAVSTLLANGFEGLSRRMQTA